MVIDKALIEDIKSSTNIVDVIGEVVSLNRAGRNYLGLCPFHKEKTPSFNVIEDRQFYHCFGCGKSGDVFKFLEEYRQISFQESVKVLADRLGIAVTIDAPRQAQQQNSPNQAFYDLHEDALKFYHAVLMTTKIGEAARAYLYERGMTDDLLKTFQIGLAPDEPDYLYQSVSKKYDEEVLTESGLFNLLKVIVFSILLKIESCFRLRMSLERLSVFQGVFGLRKILKKDKPSTKIQGLPAFSINLMNSTTSIRLSQ